MYGEAHIRLLGHSKIKHTLVFVVAPRTNTKKDVCLKEIGRYARIMITVLVLIINILFLLFLPHVGGGGEDGLCDH